jgi:hypothetical protein
LTLWLDAEDAASITLNGGTVSQLRDKSGNNFHAVQATASAQPTYVANSIGGKPTLSFDGSNDFLSIDNGPNVTPQHVIAGVFRYVSGANYRYIAKWQLGTEVWLLSPNASNATRYFTAGTSGAAFGALFPQSTPTTAAALHSAQLLSGTQSAFFNGVVGSTVATNVPTPRTNTTPVFIARALTGANTDFTNVEFAEFVMLNGANATTENRQRLEGYLAWKWGLEASLPDNHPYHDFPPMTAQPWTPAFLGSSLAIWLDASDASTITLNGSTVSQWRDRSGNGRTVTQATAANQPTYIANGISSRGSLSITTAPRWLAYTESGTVTSATIAAVGQIVDTTGNSRMAGLNTSTSGTRQSLAPASDGSVRFDGAFLSGPALPTTPFVRVSTRTAIEVFDWRNGSLGFQGAAPTESIARNFNVGNGMPLDAYALGTFTGQIGEVVVTHTALSTEDRQRIEGYLAHKWGLTASLPADHPYKTARPTV